MNRTRRALLLGGGGIFVAAAGGLVWRATNQGVFSMGRGPAYEAWSAWPPKRDAGALSLVQAAILAASPHNTQPWLFHVHDAAIELAVDAERNLGTIDPLRREQWMGLGCALENMLVATTALGWKADVALTPDAGNPTLAARVTLSDGAAKPSELFDAIPKRHTHRGPYDTGRALEDSLFPDMDKLVGDLPDVAIRWLRTPADKARTGPQIVAATEAIIADHEQSADSARWFRMDWASLQKHRDGVTLDAAGLKPWLLATVKVLPTMSQAQNDAAWLDATRKVHVDTAGAFGIIVARDSRSSVQRLDGGRLWQRIHLWASARGLAMQPLNQMPERSDREATTGAEPRFSSVLADLVGDSSWKALMPFRLGYPEYPVFPSSRRPLESVLVAPA